MTALCQRTAVPTYSNKFGHDHVLFCCELHACSAVSCCRRIFSPSRRVSNSRISSPLVLVFCVAFRKHRDSRGCGTSLLPYSTFCMGNPAEVICSELPHCHPCHLALPHSHLLVSLLFHLDNNAPIKTLQSTRYLHSRPINSTPKNTKMR